MLINLIDEVVLKDFLTLYNLTHVYEPTDEELNRFIHEQLTLSIETATYEISISLCYTRSLNLYNYIIETENLLASAS